MSTREIDAVDADVAAPPSTAMALVRLPRADVPAEKPGQPEANGHRWFYGLGYTGLGLILCAAWAGPANEAMSAALVALGVLSVGLGGVGVLIHVFYRPRMDKLRKGLGAVASVALTAAAAFPVNNAALEVHASNRIGQLEPLAALVTGTGGVRQIGVPSGGWVELNGFRGDIRSSAPSSMPDGPALNLAQVLERDGISRVELVRLTGAMEAAHVLRAEAGAAYVAFDGTGDADLLYVRPGHPLPQPGTAIMDRVRWRTKPLGDGWYLLVW
ncbi:MAG TPA: hypothetical protein VE871_02100 [Longimicrobium sp.]|nr:hypothetical protein [Longimicrobium sp.]